MNTQTTKPSTSSPHRVAEILTVLSTDKDLRVPIPMPLACIKPLERLLEDMRAARQGAELHFGMRLADRVHEATLVLRLDDPPDTLPLALFAATKSHRELVTVKWMPADHLQVAIVLHFAEADLEALVMANQPIMVLIGEKVARLEALVLQQFQVSIN